MSHARLDHGGHDAFIVWAEQRDTANSALDLTITSGAHKGEVIAVLATRFTMRDALDLVGLPCTLVVDDGAPRVAVR